MASLMGDEFAQQLRSLLSEAASEDKVKHPAVTATVCADNNRNSSHLTCYYYEDHEGTAYFLLSNL